MKKEGLIKNLSMIGPAAILVASSMGPGTVASCIMGGSHLGYKILWMALLSGFLGALVSFIGGKVYMVTGKTGFQVIRDYSHPWFAYPLFAWMFFAGCFVITVEGKLLGHTTALMAPNLGGLNDILIVPLLVLAAAIIFSFGFRKVVFLCSLMTAGMALLFLINFFFIDFSITEAVKGLAPTVPFDKTGLLAFGGIMGGSASGVVAAGYSYLVKNKGWDNVEYIPRMKLDQILFYGILFGIFSVGIYITGAAVLHPQGIEVNSAIDAAKGLEPLVGAFSKWVFLVGLFGAVFTTLGALATIMCYMLADMVGIKPDLNNVKFKILLFCTIMLGVLGPFLSGLPAMKYMVFAMVIFLLAGPAVLLIYLIVGNKKSIMGEHINSPLLNTGLIIAFILNCVGSVASVMQ
ncbi:NRAMP family divalent metal transporter [Desulfatibacillum aliphaticivorans]|uniref:NRAMP family divalent metal transporter n=1 Tax=Desulfatibacillum aliphaticivorans TaxID=218208 RepID=UPI000415B1F9|nr:divalent metal cation transporter [Desulfatibacillum aliphaticivorans]